MIAFSRAPRHGSDTGTGADRGRSLVNACVGFIPVQHISEPSQKRLSEAFIQRSVMLHQRQSKHHDLNLYKKTVPIR